MLEVALERLDVVLKAESGHRLEQVVVVDRLALLALALVRGLVDDEADELRHALLHRLLCVLRDLRIRRQSLLHDVAHKAVRVVVKVRHRQTDNQRSNEKDETNH